MNAAEFSVYADELIREMTPLLPNLAAEHFAEKGRGAILFELQDAEKPEDRKTAIKFLDREAFPIGSHVRELIHEYDPHREAILCIKLDEMTITRRVALSVSGIQKR
jgi:hypothetical protein